jgi:RNA polymerase sigma-70 factor (ECF subfamily)
METSASFLDSLRTDPDEQRWRMLIDLYTPLIRGWLIRGGALANDVDDLAQEVLVVVVRRFPEFRREPQAGAFRSWLRTIAVNCLRDHWRSRKKQPVAPGGTDFGEMIDQLSDPDSPLSQLWDREHNHHVTAYLLSRVRESCSESTWQAFQRFALDGLSADEVARELGMSPNAVFIAKSRVLASLRKLGEGLID